MAALPLPPAPPPPPRLSPAPGGRVLVLAPHPDDESVGCGGALALHAQRGDVVLVVFLTDGAAGDPDGFYRGTDYVALREGEARAAAACLGVKELEFLRLPDGRLAESEGVEDRLGELVRRFRPDVVYAPSPWESHPDHWATARALARVLREREDGPVWWAYEIWTPLIPSHLVDIGPAWEQKRQAILCYETQLRYVDYLSRIEGLHRYRTLHAPTWAYAEAYREMTAVPANPCAAC